MQKIYYICIVATGLVYGSDKLKKPTQTEFTAVTVPVPVLSVPLTAPTNPLLDKKPKALTARSSNEKDKKTSAAANPKRATCPPTYGTQNNAAASAVPSTVPVAPKKVSCPHGWEGLTACPGCGEAYTVAVYVPLTPKTPVLAPSVIRDKRAAQEDPEAAEAAKEVTENDIEIDVFVE